MAGVLGSDYNRRYDRNCFLCSHNAYAARSYGWVYYEQTTTIYKQLAAGARGLMLDIWVKGNDIYLCHESIRTTSCFKPFSKPMKLKSVFLEIRSFLDNHPQEVVTCFFESYVHNPSLMAKAIQEGNIGDIIFWQNGHSGGIDVTAKCQGWPTLKEMVKLNKRLVLFSDLCNCDGLPFEWDYCTENWFGNKGIDPRTWTQERRQDYPLDCPNSLFVMNHFPSMSCELLEPITKTMEKLNNKDRILNHAKACRKAAGRDDRLPNFVALDQINRGGNGGGKVAVQEINKWWADLDDKNRLLDEESVDQIDNAVVPATC